MPESKQHREFVESIYKWMRERYSDIKICKDLFDDVFGADRPPNIEGRIPDVYAYGKKEKLIMIGEAKIKSISSSDTYHQIETFLNYLKISKYEEKIFVLALPCEWSDEAKFLLHLLCIEKQLYAINFFIFDGFDTWELDRNGERKWHLTF